MNDKESILREFVRKNDELIKQGYNQIVISDSSFEEIKNPIKGVTMFPKSESDNFMDLSKHWVDDDSIFLFK